MYEKNRALEHTHNLEKSGMILEKIFNNSWIQDFVCLLQRYFYIQFYANGKDEEQAIIQKIDNTLKEFLAITSVKKREMKEKIMEFRKMLPKLRELVISDMKAAYEGDPAAENYMEIIVAYPGQLAVLVQRTAHCLYVLGISVLPRILTEYAHSKTAIDIHPGAIIGESFFIDHGTGVVIGETSVIGRGVKLYHGVTLGAFSTKGGQEQKGSKRHPTVEDHVTIYAGATILGGNTVIGRGTVIGGNAWVTQSVPPFAKVFSEGYKLKVQKKDGSEPEVAQKQ